jgi:hypothetical protein
MRQAGELKLSDVEGVEQPWHMPRFMALKISKIICCFSCIHHIYIYVIHRNMSSKDHVFFFHMYIYIYVRIMIKDDNKV